MPALGQPEIRDLRFTRRTQKNVPRFQIAVDESLLVREVNGVGQSADEFRGFSRRQRNTAESLAQTAPGNEFEREIRMAAVFADIVDLDDVRVLQLPERLGFAAKPSDFVPTGQIFPEDHFQCDESLERLLPRPIDHAHTAATEFIENVVTGDVGKVRSLRTSLFRYVGVCRAVADRLQRADVLPHRFEELRMHSAEFIG